MALLPLRLPVAHQTQRLETVNEQGSVNWSGAEAQVALQASLFLTWQLSNLTLISS